MKQKLAKLKKNLIIIIKYIITTQKLDFAARLNQGNLASKHNIADFVKQKTFDEKLKNCEKGMISNKMKHIETNTKVDDLEKKVKLISTT